MAIIVKKFGGSSVGSIDLIKAIAQKIAAGYNKDDSLVLVVSAMAKTTDELMRLAHQVTDHPSRRELDMLLTAGERISMSLLSLALNNEGFSSISFTGSQSGILTDYTHGNARITNVNAFRIREELEKGKIVIVAGFQGVSPAKEITTLGRGGSDTSAVALACYLQADKCEIYTDVDGVFTADPRKVNTARLIPSINYEEMLALAYSGSKVLHPRAVEFAYRFGVEVEIKSSFSFAQGSMLRTDKTCTEKDSIMEEKVIKAIAHKEDLVRYELKWDQALSQALSEWPHEIYRYYANGDKFELIIESRYESEIDHLILSSSLPLVKKSKNWAFISLIGLGINLDPGFLARSLELLKDYEIHRVGHSDKTIDLMLASEDLNACLNLLHSFYIEENQ